MSLIQLGPYYGRNITQVRRAIGKDRSSGVATLYITAPVTAPVIEVAIDRRSLYVLGFRRLGQPKWWAFEADGNLPRLDPADRIQSGPASYSNLELVSDTYVVLQPWQLLNQLATFDGRMGDAVKKRKLLLLVFLVAEALRFDCVKSAGTKYASNAGIYFSEPNHYYRNPEDLAGHRFDFTPSLVETVQNWRMRSIAGGYDVGLPWIE
jgi:hypothetical protein